MAYSGFDDMIQKYLAGKSQRLTANRIVNTGATSSSGRWHEAFAVSNGTGGIGVLTGTAGVGVAMSASDLGALPINPVSVPGEDRKLFGLSVKSPGTTLSPGDARLVDFLYKYQSCAVATGAGTVLNNAAAKPTRLANGDGVRAMCVVAGTALGAASPIITVSYTNQAGVSGRTGFFAASANSQPIGSLITGAAVNTLSGPDMIMAAGDSGIRSIDSYTVAAGTTGTVTFILYRDLAEVPIIAANTQGERDMLIQTFGPQKIDDNPCLAFIVNIGQALTANNTIVSTLNIGWG